jgi:hypothetical protein
MLIFFLLHQAKMISPWISSSQKKRVLCSNLDILLQLFFNHKLLICPSIPHVSALKRTVANDKKLLLSSGTIIWHFFLSTDCVSQPNTGT